MTDGKYYQLSEQPEVSQNALSQTVDLADRSTSNNTEYYPWPIIKDELKDATGFAFSSAAFEQNTSVHGSFSGELKIRINKRDVDIALTFYELMANGKLFELSFYIARASYAQNPSRRHLLTPGKIETISFSNTRMTGKLFKKGCRLVVIANVNKNSNAQVNMGNRGIAFGFGFLSSVSHSTVWRLGFSKRQFDLRCYLPGLGVLYSVILRRMPNLP